MYYISRKIDGQFASYITESNNGIIVSSARHNAIYEYNIDDTAESHTTIFQRNKNDLVNPVIFAYRMVLIGEDIFYINSFGAAYEESSIDSYAETLRSTLSMSVNSRIGLSMLSKNGDVKNEVKLGEMGDGVFVMPIDMYTDGRNVYTINVAERSDISSGTVIENVLSLKYTGELTLEGCTQYDFTDGDFNYCEIINSEYSERRRVDYDLRGCFYPDKYMDNILFQYCKDGCGYIVSVDGDRRGFASFITNNKGHAHVKDNAKHSYGGYYGGAFYAEESEAKIKWNGWVLNDYTSASNPDDDAAIIYVNNGYRYVWRDEFDGWVVGDVKLSNNHSVDWAAAEVTKDKVFVRVKVSGVATQQVPVDFRYVVMPIPREIIERQSIAGSGVVFGCK